MAQNLAAMTKNLAQTRANLAARGMSSSGQNTELTRRALEERQLADYTAGRGFLGGAEEGLQGLNTTQNQIAQMIADAKARAAQRISNDNPQTWDPGSEAVAAQSAKPFAGITWGGVGGITTRAALAKQLGYGQSLQQWANQHPAAWAQLR